MSYTLENGKLKHDNILILGNLPSNTKIFSSSKIDSKGTFLEFSSKKPFARKIWKKIEVESLKRFVALYRSLPYWYRPYFGIKEFQIPERTVFFLYERFDDSIVIIVPVIDKGYNIYLNGRRNGLEVMADNNCKTGRAKSLVGLYIEVGKNPYELINNAAIAVRDFVDVGGIPGKRHQTREAGIFFDMPKKIPRNQKFSPHGWYLWLYYTVEDRQIFTYFMSNISMCSPFAPRVMILNMAIKATKGG